MAQIHFGVMYDTDDGTFTEVDLDSMPVDSSEGVFDDPDWRPLTSAEMRIEEHASVLLAAALEHLNTVRRMS